MKYHPKSSIHKSNLIEPKIKPLCLAISVSAVSALSISAEAVSLGPVVPEVTELEIRANNIRVIQGESSMPTSANSRFDLQEGSSIQGQLYVEVGRLNRTLSAQTCQVNFDIVAREDLDNRSELSSIDDTDALVLDSNKTIAISFDETGLITSENTNFEVEIVSDFDEEDIEHYGIYADNMTTTCIPTESEASASVSAYYYSEHGYNGGAILYGEVTNVTREAEQPPAEEPTNNETPNEQPTNESTAESIYKIQRATAQVKTQIASNSNLSLQNARTRNKNLARELAKRRASNGGFSTGGLSANIKGQNLSLAKLGGNAGDANSAWGGFINGSIEVGDDKQFDISSNLLIAGIDYKTQHWILGAAYSYSAGTTEQKNSAESDLTQSGLSLFASYFNQGFYSNIILSQSISDYELSRTQNSQLAKSNTEGDEISYAVSAGYQASKGQWNYRAFTILDASKLDVDGYSEQGSDLNFTVQDFEREIHNLEFGIQLSYTMNMSFGVLNPLAEISYRGNTGRKMWSTQASYLADDGTQGLQALNYAIGDDKYLTGQIGITAVFPRGISAFASYQQDFSRDEWVIKQYDIGVRWEF